MNEIENKKLLQCLRNDDVDGLIKLHQNNPNIFLEHTDHPHYYAIHLAARRNALNCMEYILQSRIDPNWPGGWADYYPLHMAAERGNLKMVQLLLKYGAKPNAKDCVDCTPIISAAESKASEETKIEISKELIRYGANPGVFGRFSKGKYGTDEWNGNPFSSGCILLTALYIAEYKGENKLYDYLDKERDKWNEEHAIKKRMARFLSTLGQLITGQKKENEEIFAKPTPVYNKILSRNPDGTPDYNGSINEIINNMRQR